MTALQELPATRPAIKAPEMLPPYETAQQLAAKFAETAIARDRDGGTPKVERDLLRKSGLLTLIIPKEFGGLGSDWPEAMRITRLFARADSSIAHLFGYQHLLVVTIDLFGTAVQRSAGYAQTVRERWFWGNAVNPLDLNTTARWTGDHYQINGRKSFCSGALDSDRMIVSAWDPELSKLIVGMIPSNRAGLRINADWDNFGQRQTDSGTVEFSSVRMETDEVLKSPGPLGSPRASLRPCIAQLLLANVYLGLAEGALEEAKIYTRKQTRPWISSNVKSPVEDPYILANYGNMALELEAARLVTDRAAETLQWAWELGESITENDRGRCALDVAAAKALTTRAGLDISSRVFEVMGARATAGAARMDRFWRNVRTHTLHDPVDYKIRELGDWTLNGTIPKPTFYS